jgi:hypothetical protein
MTNADADKINAYLWNGAYEEQLMKLDQFLQEAEFEEIGTQIKLAFAWVAGTVELLVPGLSLLTKGGTALMEVMLAESMGKEEEVAMKGVKLGLESIKDIKRAGERTKVFAEHGARGMMVVGLYMDFSELKEVSRKVNEIKDALAEAKARYDELKEKLAKALPVLEATQQHLESLLKPLRKQADDQRWERDDLIQKYGYPIVGPFTWRITRRCRARSSRRAM